MAENQRAIKLKQIFFSIFQAEKRMKLEDFIRNLRQIDDGHDLDPEMLSGIYERIRNQVNLNSVLQ